MRRTLAAGLATVALAAGGCGSDEPGATTSTANADDLPDAGYPHAIKVALGEQASQVTDHNCRVTSGESYPAVARCKIRIGDEIRIFVKENGRLAEA